MNRGNTLSTRALLGLYVRVSLEGQFAVWFANVSPTASVLSAPYQRALEDDFLARSCHYHKNKRSVKMKIGSLGVGIHTAHAVPGKGWVVYLSYMHMQAPEG